MKYGVINLWGSGVIVWMGLGYGGGVCFVEWVGFRNGFWFWVIVRVLVMVIDWLCECVCVCVFWYSVFGFVVVCFIWVFDLIFCFVFVFIGFVFVIYFYGGVFVVFFEICEVCFCFDLVKFVIWSCFWFVVVLVMGIVIGGNCVWIFVFDFFCLRSVWLCVEVKLMIRGSVDLVVGCGECSVLERGYLV